VPRPRSLTPDAIAAAALAVIDRAGVDGLTMRSVAAELGMATMSLYRYVADRAELEALVVDHVLATVELTLPAGADWRARLRILVERMRAAVCAHPDLVPLSLRHRHSSAASLRWIEAMLTVLGEAGFAGTRRVVAQRTLVAFLLGVLQNQYYGPLPGAGTAAMSQLSTQDFPALTQTAVAAAHLSAEDEFALGLDAVIRGLEQ
jgi:AcrR family transcriptional regulator